MTRLIAAGAALSLSVGLFLVYGAVTVHPVRAARAGAPAFRGLPGWDRPLDGTRPPEGVYRYATTGYATLDRLGVDRRYPRETARVVTHGPGCQWRETVPVFDEHVETYSACARGGDQLDTGFGTRLVYFLVPNVADVVCATAGTRTGHAMAPGAARAFACAGTGLRVDGRAVYDGEGTAVVGGLPVACRRVTVTTVLRGSNEGGAVRELCTEPRTGLVLTERRNVGITAVSPFVGRVVYVEEATFALASLTPSPAHPPSPQ